MSRRGFSFTRTPQNWQTGHEIDAYAPNNAISNPTHPQISRLASLQRPPDYYAGGRGYRRQPYEDMIPLGHLRRPPVRVLVVGSGMAGGRIPRSRAYVNQQDMQVPPIHEEGSRLSQNEQKNVLNKLKREIYNPTARRLARTVSLYYRDPGNSSAYENVKDEDVKSCAVCLEDFEPKEEVTVTPCKHMFHQECIVPWVKSQGKCPVCRFALSESVRANANTAGGGVVGAPAAPNGPRNDLLPEEILSIIRAMDVAFPWD